MRAIKLLVAAALLAGYSWMLASEAAAEGELYNVALTTLGATAKGSGVNFNKDWPAINALKPGNGGGTIFNPFEGAKIDIRLVVPVEIEAIEIVGLDYHGTKQVSGVDIYIEGEKVTHADLPEQPGQPFRVPVKGKGQYLTLVGTGSHPVRTMPDGKAGPNWGGIARIRVYSTSNVGAMMGPAAGYQVEVNPANIQRTATAGDASGAGEVKVYGEPRMTEGHPQHPLGSAGYRPLQEDAEDIHRPAGTVCGA